MYVFFNLDIIRRQVGYQSTDIHFTVNRDDIISPCGDEWYKDIDRLLKLQGSYVLPHGIEILRFLKKLHHEGYKLVLQSKISEDYLRLMWVLLQRYDTNLPDYVALGINKPTLGTLYSESTYVNHVKACSWSTGSTYQAFEKLLAIAPENTHQHIVIDLNSDLLTQAYKLGFKVFTVRQSEPSSFRAGIAFFLNLLLMPFVFIASLFFDNLIVKFDEMIEKFVQAEPHMQALDANFNSW